MPPESKRANEQAMNASLEAFATRFRAPLMRYFQRRVATAEDAEELTQEVFVRLLRRDNINTIQNIEGFVLITAANLLKDHYRYRARRGGGKTASIENLQIRSADPNPGQVVEDRDEISVLMHAIEELPPKCRAVFTMFRFEEIPQAEIARRLGITVSMVEKHIAAAMIALKKRLRAANDERGLAKTDRRHD
jgi:RNA polymerase sigma-70 factor (ECF subfamily)